MATRTPAKKAAPAAKKTTTTSAAKTNRAPVSEEEPDLLAGLGEADAVQDDDEEIDLLEGISADNGDAWMPADDEDQPEGIQGRLVNITSLPGDPAYTPRGVTPPDIPLWEIEEKDGHVWSVRGYHSVLRNQMEKTDPEIGDLVAIKYLGQQRNKKDDNTYYNYGIACPAAAKRRRG